MELQNLKPNWQAANLSVFPDVSDRDFWNKAAANNKVRSHAEKWLNKRWPQLSASLFRQFRISGNRGGYEKVYFERRKALGDLLADYLFNKRSEYLSEIIDLVWMISEETFWGIPAHNQVFGLESPDLPEKDEPVPDIFAAETASLLSWTAYLLKPDLDKESGLVRRRIAREIERRIIKPFTERDDFWWMGYNLCPGQRVNNWNPWIVSNMLTICLLDRRLDRSLIIEKSCRLLDNFIAEYKPDGGCDEGAAYWITAGASLFDFLDQLYYASGGEFSVFQEPLIRNIGTYIAQMHIAGNYYVNFSDGSARLPHMPGNLIYRYGKRINDMALARFGAALIEEQKDFYISPDVPENFYRRLHRIAGEERQALKNPEVPGETQAWLPDLEVMTARSSADKFEGSFLACKGGHNNENHNHNDIGNFILYCRGKPVIIDVGVGTYTSKTFGGNRYEIWTMQSGYHNVPVVNEKEQPPGREYRAENSICTLEADAAIFSTELKRAYPDNSGIHSWKRIIALSRQDKKITVQDLYVTDGVPFRLNLMTPWKPEVTGKREAVFPNGPEKDASRTIMRISEPCKIRIETIQINDDRLLQTWPSKIFRVQLSPLKKTSEGQISCVFRAEKY